MRLLAPLLLTLLLTLLAPGACAEAPCAPGLGACTAEWGSSDPDCADGGSRGWRITEARVEHERAYVLAYGMSECARGDAEKPGASNGQRVAAQASSEATFVGASWTAWSSEDGSGAASGCALVVAASEPTGSSAQLLRPCPLGPPDAGWGHVLA